MALLAEEVGQPALSPVLPSTPRPLGTTPPHSVVSTGWGRGAQEPRGGLRRALGSDGGTGASCAPELDTPPAPVLL